eukprot:CAMPEP_0171155774 /NCGR_PEP_ID=MMETSP0790-20130122/1086_1 /TAXON_ID=2925 /ORGANISM="Alexandrium catenella, Strain OF101" /LENGTH=701 /DNA_ID=CAMNT_0011620029 /DNA_START=113 /DNA_END=2218 /DNA_ORIENTATION=+
MSTSVKANRKGRNLVNYSTSGLGWKSSPRRNTYIGKDCVQNRMGGESCMKHSNYDGRPPPEVKKCTTLSRAIAVEEQRRGTDAQAPRAKPGSLGDEGPEEQPKASDTQAGGGITWIDTRQQSPTLQPRETQVSSEPPEIIYSSLQEARRAAAEAHRGSLQLKQQPQQHFGGDQRKSAPGVMMEHSPGSASPASQDPLVTSRVAPGSEAGAGSMRLSQASTRSPRPGSSVFSDGRDASPLSQTLSASASQFGTSERLDPKRWNTPGAVVPEKTKRRSLPAPGGSAHYEYVVQQLRRKRDEAAGDDREELDRQLSVLLHERPAGSPRVTSPRPMVAAFTDRALRKREGMGSRGAFSSAETASQHSGGPAPGDCSCSVCKPQLASPAGNPSHSVAVNVPHFAHSSGGEVPPSSPQASRQKNAIQGKRAPGSPNYNSARISRTLTEAQLSLGDSPKEHVDENSLELQMGTKAKSRSHSADPTTAGRHRQRIGIDLESTGHHRRIRTEGCVSPSARIQAAMVLSPCDTDPPAPTKITQCKKADGENKHKFSPHAEKISVHWNPELYRYECATTRELEGGLGRCASQPSSNFVSFPPSSGKRSPRGEASEGSGSAGDYTPAAWMGGGIRCDRSPDRCKAAEVTNHTRMAEEAARARAQRLASDTRFSELCAYTRDSARGSAKDLQAVKEKLTVRQAQKMASALVWDE